MKIIFYNLGYGRGIDGSLLSYVKKSLRFIRQGIPSQVEVLDGVVGFVLREKPEVFAYTEVMTGSFRNSYFDQHKYLVGGLGAYENSTAVTKYGDSIFSNLPFHKGNCNGSIVSAPATISNHFLQHSRKKLVQQISLDKVTIFSVHLPLITSHRVKQLEELSMMVNTTKGNVVVCGDFNILNGIDELKILIENTGLCVEHGVGNTFPSHSPKIEIDVCLHRLESDCRVVIATSFPLLHSDHLPVMIEIEFLDKYQ